MISTASGVARTENARLSESVNSVRPSMVATYRKRSVAWIGIRIFYSILVREGELQLGSDVRKTARLWGTNAKVATNYRSLQSQ